MISKTPTVSVCCITYRHEAYLAQAIESVLAQQTDFAVEMVIGEDLSPDATRAIAHDYEKRYPGRVRVLAHDRNLGIMQNLMTTLAACTGEFIAFLEGDDYWVNPAKLQLQVNALRKRTDCAMCFHDAEIFYDDDSQQAHTFSEKYAHILPAVASAPVTFSQHDLGRLGWFMPSASMVFRASSLPKPLPAWCAGVFSGDYTLQLLSTRHGAALYLPQVMSRYRVHAGGIMQSSQNTLAQNTRRIHELEHYKKTLSDDLHPFFDRYLENLYFERSEKFGIQMSRAKQVYYYVKAISINRERLGFHLRRLLGLLDKNVSASAQ